MRRYNIIVIRLADLRGNGFLSSTHVDGLQRTRNCIDYNERVTALHYSVHEYTRSDATVSAGTLLLITIVATNIAHRGL